MKILVNGPYNGGNCPPHFKKLKEFCADIKLTNVATLPNTIRINTDYLNKDDIIPIEINLLLGFIVRILRKLKIKTFKRILTKKAKDIISKYKPDIVINHSASINAEIMIDTGFSPQVTLIYGSEVHGENIHNKDLNNIFEKSQALLVDTEDMKNFISNKRPDIYHKLHIVLWGHFEMHNLLQLPKSLDIPETKKKFGIKENMHVFFDCRSLREFPYDTGLDLILNSIKSYNKVNSKFQYIFLKGYLGTNKNIEKVNNLIRTIPKLKSNIIIIDKVLSRHEINELYIISNTFVSLLSHDQIGESIIDAIFSNASLILSNIDTYKTNLGENGPIYIEERTTEEMVEAMQECAERGKGKVEEKQYNILRKKWDPNKTFGDFHEFLKQVIIK